LFLCFRCCGGLLMKDNFLFQLKNWMKVNGAESKAEGFSTCAVCRRRARPPGTPPRERAHMCALVVGRRWESRRDGRKKKKEIWRKVNSFELELVQTKKREKKERIWRRKRMKTSICM
jgi:hypothetical protein